MLISIVVPLYNKENHISRTINSVLKQTYKDFELIIVDDGSTDKSVEIVKSFVDSRIFLISQVNRGVSSARNFGVMSSTAEWVAFLDADDEYSPNFLESIVYFIANSNEPSISFIGTNYFINDSCCTALKETDTIGIYNYFNLFQNLKSPNNSSTTVVRKTKLFEVGGFPENVRIFEDWITWLKLALVGNFGYIPQPLATYYKIAGSSSNSYLSPLDLYTNACSLPMSITSFTKDLSLSKTQRKKLWYCLNDFVIKISIILSRKDKRLAIKILSYLKLSYLKKVKIHDGIILVTYLFTPYFIRRLYRASKKNQI